MLLVNRLQKCLSQDEDQGLRPVASAGVGKNNGTKGKAAMRVGALGSTMVARKAVPTAVQMVASMVEWLAVLLVE